MKLVEMTTFCLQVGLGSTFLFFILRVDAHIKSLCLNR